MADRPKDQREGGGGGRGGEGVGNGRKEGEEIASCLLFPTPNSKLFYKMYVLS